MDTLSISTIQHVVATWLIDWLIGG